MAFPVWKVTVTMDGGPTEIHWQTQKELIQNNFSALMDNMTSGFTMVVEPVTAEEVV